MYSLLKYWLDSNPLTDEELHILNNPPKQEVTNTNSKDESKHIEESFFNRIPSCSINNKTHNLTVSNCATDFIDQLFRDKVNEDTLVISTLYEHPSVKNNLNNVKNVLLLNNNDIRSLNIDSIISESTKYKNVFIYIIGVQQHTGYTTPQKFFTKLKDKLTEKNIKHTIVLDDVHGMFLYPRDYSIFDYVVGTGHALVKNFGMGILISKAGEYGCRNNDICNYYIDCLDIILKRKEKLLSFNYIMNQFIYEFINSYNLSIVYSEAPHIFSVAVDHSIKFTEEFYNILKKYDVIIDAYSSEQPYIRLRGQQFIQNPQSLVIGLKKLVEILDFLSN